MERYICIHGHFYQPPRENPWLEAVELQESAQPNHDWNERVTKECYAPNATSRILEGNGQIAQLVNNYSRISFNFGPTLLAWMEEKAPEVYKAILEADKESQKRFHGHGSALAQVYNHIIMPLANGRDKYTEVIWGIRDFQRRFGRSPEGMWLPETAVDLESLEIMAELGIRFTVLAPHQAKRMRRMGRKRWQNVGGGIIDPSTGYSITLPSGKTMAIFFYDRAVAHAVAFGGLLNNGQDFAQRLLGSFSDKRRWPQLSHIATDGETYGHHHRFGDMALAYALNYIESVNLARLTNYGEYLEQNPPAFEVEIFENTSWSCAHGVERWRSDCGCHTGGEPGRNQAWRKPLRESLDWLRDTLAPLYEEEAKQLLKDPWTARNEYIAVILDRSPKNVDSFLGRHSRKKLTGPQKVTALKLLELERHALLMFSSCGWFFDDVSRIETVQILKHAARATQLAQDLSGNGIESQFLSMLQLARSNVPQHGDGQRIYEKYVRPSMYDLKDVAAHYAVASFFEETPGPGKLNCYALAVKDHQSTKGDKTRLDAGLVKVTSEITRESAIVSFAGLHLGGDNLQVGVAEFQEEKAYGDLVEQAKQAFSRADYSRVLKLFDKHFGAVRHTLKSLSPDEQRRLLAGILETALSEMVATYDHFNEHDYPLMSLFLQLGNPVPKPFATIADSIININLLSALRGHALDLERIGDFLRDAKTWNVKLDNAGLGYLFTRVLEQRMKRFISTPHRLPLLRELAAGVEMARSMPLELDMWNMQNLYYGVLQTEFLKFQKNAQRGNEQAREWVSLFTSLGKQLSVQVA